MWLYALAFLVALGAYALPRARREMMANGQMSTPTFLAAFVLYAGHGLLVLYTAFRHTWPMGLDREIALVSGILLFAVGLLIHLAARIKFRSFRLTWGLSTDRLVTSGIYAYSRNPQILGYTLFYLGIALMGRSFASLLLVGVFLVGSVVWIMMEEPILERRYGKEYRRYKRRVGRIFSFPRSR